MSDAPAHSSHYQFWADGGTREQLRHMEAERNARDLERSASIGEVFGRSEIMTVNTPERDGQPTSCERHVHFPKVTVADPCNAAKDDGGGVDDDNDNDGGNDDGDGDGDGGGGDISVGVGGGGGGGPGGGPRFVQLRNLQWECLSPASEDHVDDVVKLLSRTHSHTVTANAAHHASLWRDADGEVHALMLVVGTLEDGFVIDKERMRVPNQRLLKRLFPAVLVERARQCNNLDEAGRAMVPTCLLLKRPPARRSSTSVVDAAPAAAAPAAASEATTAKTTPLPPLSPRTSLMLHQPPLPPLPSQKGTKKAAKRTFASADGAGTAPVDAKRTAASSSSLSSPSSSSSLSSSAAAAAVAAATKSSGERLLASVPALADDGGWLSEQFAREVLDAHDATRRNSTHVLMAVAAARLVAKKMSPSSSSPPNATSTGMLVRMIRDICDRRELYAERNEQLNTLELVDFVGKCVKCVDAERDATRPTQEVALPLGIVFAATLMREAVRPQLVSALNRELGALERERGVQDARIAELELEVAKLRAAKADVAFVDAPAAPF